MLHEKTGMTVILVSHSMEDVAKYVERLIVMNDGEKMLDGTPEEVFRHYKELEAVGLAAPQVTYVMHDLKEKGFDVSADATTVEEAADEIYNFLKKRQRCSHDQRYYDRTVLSGTESDSQTGSACEDCLHTDLFDFFICAEQCAWICIGICISCVHDSRF